MLKKLFAACIMLSLVTLLIAACGGAGNNSSNSGSNSGNSGTEVHMGAVNFVQSSITISKGSSLNLVDDTGAVHIIENGNWVNGTQKLIRESGAPTINQQFDGNDTHAVGPFNTAGTYHLLCTVHPNMSLTVTVQ